MTRMLEYRVRDVFVIYHCTVTDKLHRWDMWDSLDIENGICAFRITSRPMPVALRGRIERLNRYVSNSI